MLSLLFAKGARPLPARVAALGGSAGFAMADHSARDAGRAELLASGLNFDLAGLAPAAAAAVPAHRHAFGLDGPELPQDIEAVRLASSSHRDQKARGGAQGAAQGDQDDGVLTVVRAMTGIAAALAELGGVRAVCWHPAGTCIETALFIRMIRAWLAGRAFPSLGLTAVTRGDDGSVHSDGLAFFIGQELWLEAGADETPAEAAGLAARLIHNLVEEGPVHSATVLIGSDGEQFDADPSFDGRTLRIWRRR